MTAKERAFIRRISRFIDKAKAIKSREAKIEVRLILSEIAGRVR